MLKTKMIHQNTKPNPSRSTNQTYDYEKKADALNKFMKKFEAETSI